MQPKLKKGLPVVHAAGACAHLHAAVQRAGLPKAALLVDCHTGAGGVWAAMTRQLFLHPVVPGKQGSLGLWAVQEGSLSQQYSTD